MLQNANDSQNWRNIEEVPFWFFRSSVKFQGYMGKKIDDLIPILSKITRPVAAIKSLRFALFDFKVVHRKNWGSSCDL